MRKNVAAIKAKAAARRAAIEQRFGGMPFAELVMYLHDEQFMTLEEIYEYVGVTRMTTRRWMRGIRVKRHPHMPLRGADVRNSLALRVMRLGFRTVSSYACSRAADGWTRRQMAAELGCAPHSIYGAIMAEGGELPPPVRTQAQVEARRAHMIRLNAEGRAGRRGNSYLFTRRK